MNSLMQRYEGDYKKVCVHTADALQSRYGFDEKVYQEFVEWMYSKKDCSASNYEKGLFFDNNMYYHAFKVHKKIHSKSNQHHIVLVSGKIGKGKSTLGAQLCALIDDKFCIARVVYIGAQFLLRVAQSDPGDANLVDEGGEMFKRKKAMNRLNKDISDATQKVRELKQCFVICYDEPHKCDPDLLEKVDTLIVKYQDNKEQGERKYRSYFAFNSAAYGKVLPHLLKRTPIWNPSVLSKASWKGHNSSEFPEINDFSEDAYRSNKEKFLRSDFLKKGKEYYAEYFGDDFEEENQAPYTPSTTPCTVTNVPVKEPPPKKLYDSKFVKKYFGISDTTVNAWIEAGKLKCVRIGTTKRYNLTEFGL